MKRWVTAIAAMSMGVCAWAQAGTSEGTRATTIARGSAKTVWRYDLSREKVLAGHVTRVFTAATSDSRELGQHLIVLVDGKETHVFLAPVSYMEFLDVTVTKGTWVRMRGAFVSEPGDEAVFIVRALHFRGNETQIIFRDESGRPLWMDERGDSGDEA